MLVHEPKTNRFIGYEQQSAALITCIQTSRSTSMLKYRSFVSTQSRVSVARDGLKWLLKVRILELNQAQQTVDRLVVGWLGSKASAC